MTVIQIRNLVKTYPTPEEPLRVLRGIDLDLCAGDFAAVVGPSGAGKTTFLNMLTGIDKPTEGEITVGGHAITPTTPIKWRARQIGIVFSFFQLLPTLTVLENILFPMDMVGARKPSQRRQAALDLLDQFDVRRHADKTPDMLSGGEQQRVAIARALANDPPIIVGDEPTSNLDRMNAEIVFKAFHNLARQGKVVVIVTYDRALVKDVPNVFELNEGLLHEVKNVSFAMA